MQFVQLPWNVIYMRFTLNILGTETGTGMGTGTGTGTGTGRN